MALSVVALLVAASAVAGCGGDDGTPSQTLPPAPTGASSAGPASAAGVTVDQASVDLGRVPLDKMINQTWKLRNDGSGKAQLGSASIEVLEGC